MKNSNQWKPTWNEMEAGFLVPKHLDQFVCDQLSSSLLVPVADITERPSKRLRAELVEIGFNLSGQVPIKGSDRSLIQRCAELVELLHAGSLVIDDIQDQSLERRGQPTLHRRYGVPIAINAGNWLYFWPLTLIRRLGLPPENELQMYRAYHETLIKAHMGQALDLGVAIDQVPDEEIYALCIASLEFKSGTLAAFSLALGAIAAGASEARINLLTDCGMKVGTALQMFDDLSNLSESGPSAAGAKRFEDLRLRRPSWIWACLSRYATTAELNCFRALTEKLPDSKELEQWLNQQTQFLNEAKLRAETCLRAAITDLAEAIHLDDAMAQEGFSQLQKLGQRLAESYV